jgi:hypothetical protein
MMEKRVRKTTEWHTLILAGTMLACLVLLPGISQAGSNWWEKGVEALKSVTGGEEKDSLSISEIGAGLKDALRVGTENVVGQLGSLNGFNNDPSIHIPLPKKFKTIKSMLSKVGKSRLLDDLELKLNRAAEAATPKAKKLFWQSISEMSFEDVKAIYKGPDDAATQYFRKKMTPALSEEMRPVVDEGMSKVGAIKAYDKVMGQYRALPFVPDIKANMTNYVLEKGMDGIFYYLAREEAAIRKNPAKRTTDLLKRLFGKR